MNKDTRIIQVSFNSTTRDVSLYMDVMKKEKYEKSAYVKDALEHYKNFLEKKV